LNRLIEINVPFSRLVPIAFLLLVTKDLLASYDFQSSPLIIFAVFIGAAAIKTALNGRVVAVSRMIPPTVFFGMLFCTFACLAHSYLTIGKINGSNYIWSFWIALIFSAAGSGWILRMILLLPFVNLVLQFYESQTGEVLYQTISRFDDLIIGTDEWSIGLGVLRTKGLFQGPLHVVTVSILAILLSPKFFPIRFVMFMCTFLGAARLGLVASFALCLEWFIRRIQQHSYKVLSMLVLVLGCFLLLLPEQYLPSALINADRYRFISILFDFNENESNSFRAETWLFAIKFYLNYDCLSMLFGKFNEVRYSFGDIGQGGGTESDWLLMLVDNGIIGLLVYLVAFVNFFKLLSRHSPDRVPVLIVLFIVMNLFPSLSFLVGALEFWLIYFALLEHFGSNRTAIFNHELHPTHLITLPLKPRFSQS
jgi:hypothetical protein